MSNILINLAAEFTGKKAFKQAAKSTSALEKGVKSLGKTFGIALSAQAVVAFGKASVKAFIDDQKAAVLLANAVKNLGIEMEAPAIENFVKTLSAQTAMAANELRPAMQELLTTTGSITKSQKMLTDAIEISRGSGVDLATVTKDLSNAYLGNTKGLKKYNLGLTSAELQATSFSDIQEKLNNQFKGSNAAYLDTYAGKIQALSAASGEAQETIGKGLVDALVILVGQDQGISGLTGKFSQLATDIAEVTTGMAAFYKSVEDGGSALSPLLDFMQMANDKLPNIYKVLGWFKKFAPANSTDATGVSTIGEYNESQDQMKRGKARAKLEADAEKRAKILAAAAAKTAAAAKKAAAEAKKEAALKKASSIFDMEQIQLIAALKGNVSAEDRRRLELQLALATGNVEEAKRLTYQLAISQGLTAALAKDLASLPAANNPFAAWKGYLDDVELQAKRIAAFKPPAPQAPATPNPPVITPPKLPNTEYNAGTYVPSSGYVPPTNVSPIPGVTGGGGQGMNTYASSSAFAANNPIVIQIDGKTVAEALQTQSMSGTNTRVDRTNGSFNW
jgi:hypothetical protein